MCILERFDFVADEVLADRFRKKANELGKYKKGSLSIAFQVAIRQWLKNPSLDELTKKKKTRRK